MRIAHSAGARAFFFVTMTAFNKASLQLVNSAEEAFQQSQRGATLFNVFVLNGEMLFGEAQLPSSIPH
jgi:hypothetical protein